MYDLGIFFYSILSYSYHIQFVCNDALKMLDFIKRNAIEFSNINTIKAFYVALVISHVGYCTLTGIDITLYISINLR